MSNQRIGCNICGEALPDGEPHLCAPVPCRHCGTPSPDLTYVCWNHSGPCAADCGWVATCCGEAPSCDLAPKQAAL